MIVSARLATKEDLPVLEHLYRSLEDEMVLLHQMWPLADGLPEPVGESLASVLEDDRTVTVIGSIDQYPLGFLMARAEPLLPQAGGETVGSIRLVFVDPEAREVGVGEAMRDLTLDILRERGIVKFDAHVLPGHRLVKNFFEAGGFSARSIIMHHNDDDD